MKLDTIKKIALKDSKLSEDQKEILIRLSDITENWNALIELVNKININVEYKVLLIATLSNIGDELKDFCKIMQDAS